jgi:transcriptional regulator with XRE-family HTH domain
MYPNLKIQIWKLGMRQNRLAQILGIDETLLSRIINGYREADTKLRAELAVLLDKDERWLFSPFEGDADHANHHRPASAAPVAIPISRVDDPGDA